MILRAQPLPSDIGIHDYLDADILLYLFKLIVKENPWQVMRFAQVSVFWRDLTNHNTLWKEYAKKLNIDVKNSELKKEIARVIAEARTAIQAVHNLKLLEFDEPREFVFNAMRATIQNMPRGVERNKMMEARKKKIEEKQKRFDTLQAACLGQIRLAALGLGTIECAEKIAGILATDKYLDPNPLKEVRRAKRSLSF